MQSSEELKIVAVSNDDYFVVDRSYYEIEIEDTDYGVERGDLNFGV